ncbi:MAG: ATP-dependent Clp protease ATP-binding subunit, partial [Candidatus Angelobacter sp.]
KLGDFIRIDRKDGVMTFTKEAEGALVPVLLEKYGELNPGSPLAAKAARGSGKPSRDFGGIAPLLDHK